MHKLFYGVRAASTDEIMQECLRRMSSPRQTFFYVVPTARRARTLESALLKRRPQGFFKPHLLTFHSLVNRLYSKTGGTGVPIPQTVKAMLIEEIMSDKKLELAWLARREGRPFPGLVAKLAAFISDCKQNLIDPDELERRLSKLERPLTGKSRELARIYRRYQALLEQHELIDTDGMFWLVLDNLQQPGRLGQALDDVDLLIFDRFFDVTHAEGKVLERLLELVENVWLRVDWQPGSPAFAAADAFVQRFCLNAEKVEIQPPGDSPASTISRLLFTEKTSNADPRTVVIMESKDRQAEIESIAREIKRLVLTQQIEPERIAIAFKNIDLYAPIVRDIFGSCGIPFTCTAGRPLAESPVTAALLGLLDIIHDNYSRQSITKLLRSPYVRYVFHYEGETAALDGGVLDSLAREARVFRGREDWAHKLNLLAEEYKHALDSQQDDTQREALAAGVADVRRQAAGIASALGEIAKLEGSLAAAQFGETFHALVRRFKVVEAIFFDAKTPSDTEILKRDYRALQKFNRVLDDLVFAASFSGRETFTLDEYRDMLDAGLAGESLDSPGRDGTGVQVLPVDEVRGGDYDVVFLAGMVDAEFPQPEGPQIFYSIARRRQLGFKVEPANLAIERYLFADTACTPRTKLFVSYPRSDGSIMLLESLFVRQLEERLPGVVTHTGTPDFFSPKTLMRHLASTLGGRDEAQAAEALEVVRSVAPDAPLRRMLTNIAIQEQRRRCVDCTAYQGILADPAVRQAVADRYANRIFSPSRLEKYARCPFRFFAEQALRLVEMEEPEEDIDALERGSVVHRILTRFYLERRKSGTTSLTAKDDPDKVLDHIRTVAEDEFRRLPYEGVFWEAECEKMLGGGSRKGILPMFVESEMADTSLCKPCYFEVVFGRSRYDEPADTTLSLPELVVSNGCEQIRIAGRIDRVDVCEDEGVAVVFDYKTGAAPDVSDIQKGLSLQLPIYMLALSQHSEFEVIGGGYYQLKDDPEKFGKMNFFGDGERLKSYCGVGSRVRKGMLSQDELAEFLDLTRERIRQYVSDIRNGRFNVTTLDPSEAGCRYCSFRSVCRRDEAE